MAYKMAVARLSREVEAADIMTREVVAVSETTSLAEVAGVMGARGISGVPVLDDRGRVSGVISEKDFLRKMGVPAGGNFMTLVANCLSTKGCVAIPIKNQQARDLMSSPPVVIPPELQLREISALFGACKVNRAPVVDGAGALVGIVSRGDLVQAIFQEINTK
jgi:CBS domain-containing protein